MYVATGVKNTEIKNNIIAQNDSYEIHVDSPGTGTTIEHNIYHNDVANDWYWGAAKNWADWKTACNCDTASPASQTGDPLMVDPANGSPTNKDFRLQSSSPAIDAGATLGATWDDMINPTIAISDWPDSISSSDLLDQDLYGSGWEIGAYVYLEEEVAKQRYMDNSSITGEVR